MSQIDVTRNSEKYQAMRDALNEYYWDNGISPEATAAMLKTFADEVSRLAKFIYDNAFCLDPRSPTTACTSKDDTTAACHHAGKFRLPSGRLFCPICQVYV